MATRLRKTRRLRGGRHMGWGQVGQHRASGHKGGLGITGMKKHHRSTMIKEDPDHYGHDIPKTPHPNIIKNWASLRDLDDLFVKFGKEEGGKKICRPCKRRVQKTPWWRKNNKRIFRQSSTIYCIR